MPEQFHDRQFPCSIPVPAGPGYTDLNQGEPIYAIAIAVPGKAYVDGDPYLASKYGYSSFHLWGRVTPGNRRNKFDPTGMWV